MSERVVEIVRREEFSAAHRLVSPHLSDEQNRRLYGPCYGDHGHNYELEVSVRGPVDPKTGMVMNLTDLMGLVRERVVLAVDHKHLNHDVDFLRGIIPTAENVAMAFWGQLEEAIRGFPGCRLHRIRLYESRNNFVDYLGPQAPPPRP
jgi:6-pyruvoyltetrahydropterin/6-carboxytetrahydropterin synthase